MMGASRISIMLGPKPEPVYTSAEMVISIEPIPDPEPEPEPDPEPEPPVSSKPGKGWGKGGKKRNK